MLGDPSTSQPQAEQGTWGSPNLGNNWWFWGTKINLTERELLTPRLSVKWVPSSSGQYQSFFPSFLSFSTFLFILSLSLFLFFILFYFSLPKLIYITVNASQSGHAALCSKNRTSPNKELGTDVPMAHLALLSSGSTCPGTRKGNILFCTTAAHHVSLVLPWTPRPGGQQDSGLGTGHSQSPGPLCLSSKAHLVLAWKDRETFMGYCMQAAAPAHTWEFCKCSTCTNFIWVYSQLFSAKNGPVLVY